MSLHSLFLRAVLPNAALPVPLDNEARRRFLRYDDPLRNIRTQDTRGSQACARIMYSFRFQVHLLVLRAVIRNAQLQGPLCTIPRVLLAARRCILPSTRIFSILSPGYRNRIPNDGTQHDLYVEAENGHPQ